MMPETALSRISADNMSLSFLTNAVGPMLTCQHFMPLLTAAEKENGASESRPAVVANMSARVGSIGTQHSHLLPPNNQSTQRLLCCCLWITNS
jgi:NAD(P)-dependent dehydrogenase (short-subunit alcohol dehydrogenase family)